MEITPFAISTLRPPKDDLLAKIQASSLTLLEGDVIALSSKVVSIHQGRCAPRDGADIDALVRQEADAYLERSETPGGFVMQTITHGALASNAGIDPFGGYVVLLPQKPQETAEELLAWFKQAYGIRTLYLIITDSKSVMLRRGVVGGALAWAGFAPLYDNRARTDLLGYPTSGSQTNLPDSLAAAAVFVMGEANEGTPLVRMRDVPYVGKGNESKDAFVLRKEEDIFAPFLMRAPWQKGGQGR